MKIEIMGMYRRVRDEATYDTIKEEELYYIKSLHMDAVSCEIMVEYERVNPDKRGEYSWLLYEELFEDNYEFTGEYINSWIVNGNISIEDHEPLKCSYCDSTKLEDIETLLEDKEVVKSYRTCKVCEKTLGHWSYGQWED